MSGLSQLLASLERGLGCAEPLSPGPTLARVPPAAIGAHQHVVVWLIDGFALEYRPHTPHLDQDFATPLDTVFPSTTASAITSLFTGLTPTQHGLLGWKTYLPTPNRTLTVLPAKETDPDGNDVALDRHQLGEQLRLQPLFDRLPRASTVVSPAAIARSPYNQLMSGNARIISYKHLEALPALLGAHVRAHTGPQYTYVYWSDLDRLGHDAGPRSPDVRAHLKQIDAAYIRLCARLEGTDTLLLITADHGMRPVYDRLDLSVASAARACLRHPLTGEPRAALAHVRPGQHAAFEHAVQAAFGDRVQRVAMDRWLAGDGFGLGTPHSELRERAGDFLLLPDPDSYLVDPVGEDPGPHFLGAHGGLTPAECEIPLFLRHFTPVA